MKQRGGVFGLFTSKEDQLKDALFNDNFSKATDLVNKGANVNKIFPPYNDTALIMALGKHQRPESLQFIKLIIDKGANINTGDYPGSPLASVIRQFNLNTEFYSTYSTNYLENNNRL
jgi:hypothetical protein